LGDQNRLAEIIDDDEEEEARSAKRRAIERSRTTASKGQEKAGCEDA